MTRKRPARHVGTLRDPEGFEHIKIATPAVKLNKRAIAKIRRAVQGAKERKPR